MPAVPDPSVWNPPADALSIWGDYTPGFDPTYGQPVPTLTPFITNHHPGELSSAVIVLPGGGYARKAPHEARPIAEWLNSLGISAFVLDYRVAPYHHPIPLLDARRALQVVRSRASEWSLDSQRIGVLGFSAGGHLASTVGTHFEEITAPETPQDEVSSQDYRPNALVLCYPVISFCQFSHVGSMENLLGPNPSDELRLALSNENNVTDQTPPTFLFTTATDQAVPVENSLSFGMALSAKKIPFELHVFDQGAHGLGLAQGHPSAQAWPELCASWFHRLGFA